MSREVLNLKSFHVLARLAILAHGTDLMECLDAVETPEDAIAAIRDCESASRR